MLDAEHHGGAFARGEAPVSVDMHAARCPMCSGSGWRSNIARSYECTACRGTGWLGKPPASSNWSVARDAAKKWHAVPFAGFDRTDSVGCYPSRELAQRAADSANQAPTIHLAPTPERNADERWPYYCATCALKMTRSEARVHFCARLAE